jgi:hypothetical protein
LILNNGTKTNIGEKTASSTNGSGKLDIYMYIPITQPMQKMNSSCVLVAHSCNPSYSGGRDLGGLQLEVRAGQIVHKTLSQKHPSQKRDGGVAQGINPEFRSQYCKKKINKFKIDQRPETYNLLEET